MVNTNKNNNIVKKILAWISLAIIFIILCIMLYALINGNGRLALAMIVTLAFISILLWVGIKIVKDSEYINKLVNKDK